MIVKVDGTNISEAAHVHAVSWRESHKSVCSAEFAALHTDERQTKYLLSEMSAGKEIFMLTNGRGEGIVSVCGNVIENLYVLPKAQNRGIGSELLEYAESVCDGIPTLSVMSTNEHASEFYKKRCYYFTGREKPLGNGVFEREMKKDVFRSEDEMLSLILNTALSDERIRAVILCGSRADENCPRDIYQDFDVAYIVRDVAPFYNKPDEIYKIFGVPAIAQLPENSRDSELPPDNDGHFTYLMLFEDGNRIDLTYDVADRCEPEEPRLVLLDKDGAFADVKPNAHFWDVQKPEEHLFSSSCNEFYWCLNNVIKGIARDELPYAFEMFNKYVRDMLNRVTRWYIGANNGFAVSPGKLGKYFKRYLPRELYDMYIATYCGADGIFDAVDTSIKLFYIMSTDVASKLGFTVNESERESIVDYMNRVRARTASDKR